MYLYFIGVIIANIQFYLLLEGLEIEYDYEIFFYGLIASSLSWYSAIGFLFVGWWGDDENEDA